MNEQRRFRRLLATVLVTGLAGLNITPALAGTTWYVDASATGNDNGSEWEHAFDDLQEGLSAASSDDEIWVAAGTYRPSEKTDPLDDRTATFQLINGVAIYGGFAGDETQRDQRDPAANETILSGDIGTAGIDSDNCYHVVTASGSSITDAAILDGFTITGGYADDGNDSQDRGAGVFCPNQASPTIVNCHIAQNTCTVGGGGIYCNSSNGEGGPTIIDCIFTENSAHSGGALASNGTDVSFKNCTMTGNTATNAGGAIYLVSDGQNGSDATFVNCTIAGNTAANYGGALSCGNDTAPLLVNCVVTANSVTGNSASGGGINCNTTGRLQIINCTVSNNTAAAHVSARGGGLYTSNGDPTISNTIFWGNSDAAGSESTAAQIYVDSGTPSVVYSCIQDDDPEQDVPFSATNIDDNPEFFRDPNDGGDGWNPAHTNDDYGDLRLVGGSPCVDEGIDDALDLDEDEVNTDDVPYDLDGRTRIGGDSVDMGAYEQKIWYVDASADGFDNGLTWEDAYDSIDLGKGPLTRSLLNENLVFGDQIWVADGTYYPTHDTDRTKTFTLVNGVKVFGGFHGYVDLSEQGETSLAERDLSANVCVLSGDIDGTAGTTSGDSHHVVTGAGKDSSTRLDGFTITGGYASGTGDQNNGAGVFCDGVNPMIANCRFVENYASADGGAMYIDGGASPSVVNCVFTDNEADDGGALAYIDSTPAVTNCTFTDNDATTNGSAL